MSDLRRRRAGIPTIEPLRRSDLRWFDLSRGMVVALRVLRSHLGTRSTIRVLAALARIARIDPLARISVDGWDPHAVTLARHQLRPVLLLDDALRDALGLQDRERLVVLRDVVSETGAEFVGTYMPVPDRESWIRASAHDRSVFIRALTARMFNARVERWDVGDDHLAFDVTACLFVELCQAVKRPALAPLFCEADARYFTRERSLVSLARTGTIAGGHACCDFRFRYRG